MQDPAVAAAVTELQARKAQAAALLSIVEAFGGLRNGEEWLEGGSSSGGGDGNSERQGYGCARLLAALVAKKAQEGPVQP